VELPASPPPSALADLLPSDVDLDAGWRHPAARPVWFGVVWGRLGRSDLAVAHLDRVRLPALQPWIAAERGRLLREVGLHDRAEAVEWPALLTATDAVDDAMLRLSLAADAVGLGDAELAARRLAVARDRLDAAPPGPRRDRQRLRASWVVVEVAGALGASPPTDDLPTWDAAAERVAWPALLAAGSRFHAAKAALFAGVVHAERRLLDAAATLAPPALARAVALARADAAAAAGEPDTAASHRAEALAAWDALRLPAGWHAEVATTPAGRRFAEQAAQLRRRPCSS
jgi:hypothetical protein